MATINKILDYIIWITIIFLLIFKSFNLINGNNNSNIIIDTSKLEIKNITDKNIVNVIVDLPKSKQYTSRDKSTITAIVIHHTASDNSNPLNVAKVGIERFGYGHSYHYEIDTSGIIYQTNWISSITAHCKENNSVSIGIVLDGNFEKQIPTNKQLESLIELCKYLKVCIPSITEINGHNFYNKLTSCPGRNLNVNEIKKYVFDEY
jgi:N-acetyl-anhydromuramyl-L-alanine amidase AmpD